MCYLTIKELHIIPETTPDIWRHCAKCGEKSSFKNSKKFRLNANKSNLDAWLIYKCQKCETTWNMPIYERVPVNAISPEELIKLQNNDEILAKEYGFNLQLLGKSKAQPVWNQINYTIDSRESYPDNVGKKENTELLIIKCNFPLNLRIDKILAEYFQVSRSRLKKMVREEILLCPEKEDFLKTKIKDGLKIQAKINADL